MLPTIPAKPFRELSSPRERASEDIELSRRIIAHLRHILAKGGLEDSHRKEIEALLEQEFARLKNRSQR